MPGIDKNSLNDGDQLVSWALARSGGKVAPAARELGISRQSLHERLSRKPHLRPAVKIDEDTIFSSMVFWECLQSGEPWAYKKALLSHWGKKPRRHARRPRHSDAEMEKLIFTAGGSVEEYLLLCEAMAPNGFKSLEFRRRVIEEAAAITLSVDVRRIWKVLKKAWVKLQTINEMESVIKAIERAPLKKRKSS